MSKYLKFLLAGGSAAAVEYIAFLALTHIEAPTLIANSFSFLCGLVVSFSLNKTWVFASKQRAHAQFVKYFCLAGINLVISNLLVWAIVYGLSMPGYIAKLMAMVVIAAWNYFIFSKFIFKD